MLIVHFGKYENKKIFFLPFLVLTVPINFQAETFLMVGRGLTSPVNIPSTYLRSAEVRKYDLGKVK